MQHSTNQRKMATLLMQKAQQQSSKQHIPLHMHVEQALKDYMTTSKGQPIRGLYDILLAAVEPALLKVVLENSATQVEAATMLGLSRVTLRKKLNQYLNYS